MSSLGHFTSSFVGEGECENLIGRGAGLQEPRDSMRNHAGLAGTWSCQHQQGAFRVFHRSPLGCRQIARHLQLSSRTGKTVRRPQFYLR
jgi:hypothetical protein